MAKIIKINKYIEKLDGKGLIALITIKRTKKGTLTAHFCQGNIRERITTMNFLAELSNLLYDELKQEGHIEDGEHEVMFR